METASRHEASGRSAAKARVFPADPVYLANAANPADRAETDNARRRRH